MYKKLASAAVVAGLVTATWMNSTGTASAATRAGVDMQAACSAQNPGYGLQAVVKDQHNAYSWRCVAPWGYSVGIDVNRACVTQYGRGSAGLISASNPYSWYCAI